MRTFGCQLICAAAFVLCGVVGCSKTAEPEQSVRDSYVYEPIRMAAAYLTLMEKPDAVRALLIGEEARKLTNVFEHVGVKAVTAKTGGRYDVVLVACDEMSPESYARAADLLTENGVIAWMMDVRDVTFGQFRCRLESFQSEQVHLWMPGDGHWLLVGRPNPRQVKLDSMLEVFTREGAFDDFASACSATVPEMFASYTGTREDVMPVFQLNDATAEVRPECFVTKDIPPLDWVSDVGLDSDIAQQVRAEIRSMQVVRRLVLEGKILSQDAKDKKSEEPAVEKWNAAALRNPRDLMLLERLDRLDRNARGFLSLGKILQAMKCYETMILIRPTAASVHNFGKCLEKVGKRELAEQAFKRARELQGQQ